MLIRILTLIGIVLLFDVLYVYLMYKYNKNNYE